MGLIFWIDENTFATSLAERALTGQGVDFYTVNSAKDFAYLIVDLKPQTIVIESHTVLKELALFREQYEATQKFFGAKIVLINPLAELSFLENTAGTLNVPFNPFTLKEFFSNI